MACENDDFAYLPGDEKRIVHRGDFRQQRSKASAVYDAALWRPQEDRDRPAKRALSDDSATVDKLVMELGRRW